LLENGARLQEQLQMANAGKSETSTGIYLHLEHVQPLSLNTLWHFMQRFQPMYNLKH
jgi:hypothetical protein